MSGIHLEFTIRFPTLPSTICTDITVAHYAVIFRTLLWLFLEFLWLRALPVLP